MDLEKELEKARIRASKSTYLEAKKELSEETYPLLQAIWAEVHERIGDLEDTVAELIEQQGSYLQTDLSAQILTTLQATKEFIAEVANIQVDDLTKHKLGQMMGALVPSIDLTMQAVSEVTSEYEEEEGEDEDDETEDDDEDEDAEEGAE